MQVRRYWAVENQLHWCLDVIFDKDSGRAKKYISVQITPEISRQKQGLHIGDHSPGELFAQIRMSQHLLLFFLPVLQKSFDLIEAKADKVFHAHVIGGTPFIAVLTINTFRNLHIFHLYRRDADTLMDGDRTPHTNGYTFGVFEGKYLSKRTYIQPCFTGLLCIDVGSFAFPKDAEARSLRLPHPSSHRSAD